MGKTLKGPKRCQWVNLKNKKYVSYHDKEWGVPVRRDKKLFEMLILEGAQAGLSWETVLNKRAGYKKAFYNFDIEKCSKLTDKYLEKQLENPEIIRNRLKVYSVRSNALALLTLKKETKQSFSKYLWSYVDSHQIKNKRRSLKDVPAKTELSDKISKDLKNRGFKFIGSTIIYAYMQAVGIVDDHTVDCFKYKK